MIKCDFLYVFLSRKPNLQPCLRLTALRTTERIKANFWNHFPGEQMPCDVCNRSVCISYSTEFSCVRGLSAFVRFWQMFVNYYLDNKFTHHVSEHFPKFQMITEDCRRRPSKIRRQFDHPPTFLSTVTGSNTVQFKDYDSEGVICFLLFCPRL